MSTKRTKPPGEKKRLSYERDGRNTYGENSKSSRKAIPKFKAASNRSMRHATKQSLSAAAISDNDAANAKLADQTFIGLHPSKKKVPDLPLGLLLNARAKTGSNWAVRRMSPKSKARTGLRHGKVQL
jgi:hypothetical protein